MLVDFLSGLGHKFKALEAVWAVVVECVGVAPSGFRGYL